MPLQSNSDRGGVRSIGTGVPAPVILQSGLRGPLLSIGASWAPGGIVVFGNGVPPPTFCSSRGLTAPVYLFQWEALAPRQGGDPSPGSLPPRLTALFGAALRGE